MRELGTYTRIVFSPKIDRFHPLRDNEMPEITLDVIRTPHDVSDYSIFGEIGPAF